MLENIAVPLEMRTDCGRSGAGPGKEGEGDGSPAGGRGHGNSSAGWPPPTQPTHLRNGPACVILAGAAHAVALVRAARAGKGMGGGEWENGRPPTLPPTHTTMSSAAPPPPPTLSPSEAAAHSPAVVVPGAAVAPQGAAEGAVLAGAVAHRSVATEERCRQGGEPGAWQVGDGT